MKKGKEEGKKREKERWNEFICLIICNMIVYFVLEILLGYGIIKIWFWLLWMSYVVIGYFY